MLQQRLLSLLFLLFVAAYDVFVELVAFLVAQLRMRSPSSAPVTWDMTVPSIEEVAQLLEEAESQLKRFDSVSEALERDVHALRALVEQVPAAAHLERTSETSTGQPLVFQWNQQHSAHLDRLVTQERATEASDMSVWRRVADALKPALPLVGEAFAPESLAEACRTRYLAVEAYRKRADWADEQLTTMLLGLDAVPGVSRQALLLAHQLRRTAQAKQISALIGRRKKLIDRCLAIEAELEQQRVQLGLLPTDKNGAEPMRSAAESTTSSSTSTSAASSHTALEPVPD